VLLMDEPFGALDPVTREALQQEMLRIHRLLGRTIVLVTHDIDEALRLADHLVLMDGGEVVQQGAPLEMLLRPKNSFVQTFLAAASWACACCRCARCGTICVPTSGWRARG
jgi:osmoprotectant transport system ATP-binding protein